MRLIDLDAFREEYDLREHCDDCGRRNKKACDYPSYSARDFCGWLDDVPTVEAVPLDKLCDWLAARYEPPMKLDDIEFLGSPYKPEAEEHRRIVWLRVLRDWMQKEGLNEVDRC